jgi:hypothetical protein
VKYLRLGWSALALCPPDHSGNLPPRHLEKCKGKSLGKVPLWGWKEYQTRLPTPKELGIYFGRNPGSNVGVALGPVSNLLAIDVDGDGGEEMLKNLSAEDVPETLEFRSGNGRRLLFAWPEGQDLPNEEYRFGGGEVRVLCKGRQTVMPPSVHYSGVVYEWVQGRGPSQVEAAPCPDWLLSLLASRGPRQEQGPAPLPIQRTAQTPDVIHRAMAYMAKYPPGQEGADASGNCFALACRLVRGFSLDADTALRLLLHSEWNGKCLDSDGRPWPWTAQELRHKIEDAARAPEKKQEGYLLNAPRKEQPRPARPARGPGDWPEGGTEHATGAGKKDKRKAAQAEVVEEPVELAVTCLSDIRPQPIHWLIDEHVPLGKMTLLAGDGGDGKSSIMLSTAANVTRGRPCWGLDYQPPPVSDVLLIGCEDDYADTVVPRLLSAGADLHRIHKVDGVRTAGGKVAPFSLAHYQAMDQSLKANPEIRLVVIDPAGAFIGRTGVDEHKDADLRSLLDPMAELAAARRVTIVLIKHFNKGGSPRAVHKVSGSVGYVNSVRAAYVVMRDPDDDGRKLLLPIKFNIGRHPRGRAYRMETLPESDQDAVIDRHARHLGAVDQVQLRKQLFRVRWLGSVDTDADAVVAASQRHGRGPSKADQAAEWLPKFLGGFAWPSDEVFSEGVQAGFTRSNLFAAKKRLGTVSASNRGRFGGVWHWALGDPRDTPIRPKRRDEEMKYTSDTKDTSHTRYTSDTSRPEGE